MVEGGPSRRWGHRRYNNERRSFQSSEKTRVLLGRQPRSVACAHGTRPAIALLVVVMGEDENES
jgi:hypothetical protein